MSYQEPISEAWLITKRRELHKWPEPGWAEFVSTIKAIRAMEAAGFDVKCGREVIHPDYIYGANANEVAESLSLAKTRGVTDEELARLDGVTGAVGIFRTGRPGPVVAIRCELDCVPVQETDAADHIPNREGFASEHKGYMHACSHEGPQAILCGLAQWISENRDQLKGTIKLIFQPGEEGGRGARPMSKSGILDDVDYLYCGHFGCDAKPGELVLAPQKFLCSAKFNVNYKGQTAHSAMHPEQGHNAVMAAATGTLSAMATPRHYKGASRINVGIIHGGEGRNVIPANAWLQCDVRGENEEVCDFMLNESLKRLKAAGDMYGCETSYSVFGQTYDFKTDPEAAEIARKAACGVPNITKVSDSMLFGGSEDGSILAKTVQAHGGKCAYLILGSELKDAHHRSHFDFEEKYLISLYEIYRNIVKILCAAETK